MNDRRLLVMAAGGHLMSLCIATAQPAEKYAGNCTDAGCHATYTQQKVVHAPISQGACDACHEEQKGQTHKFRLVKEPGELCIECHTDVTKDLPHVHGPVAVNACTACHQPHSSAHAHLLKAPEKELCLECHASLQQQFAAGAKVHRPVSDGCLTCHGAHGAKNKLLLTAELPALCLDCHDNIADRMSPPSTKHSPTTSERGCLNCHHVHASKDAGLLLKPTGELCMSCHNAEIRSQKGPVHNIATVLAGNSHHHGPVADGECAACHDPHGGANAHLLGKAYPAAFYTGFDEKNYALCFECHEAEAFTEKQTDSATGFRHGSRNLHYVHVNHPTKGRTCRACHDPHASKNAKHIVESVPFGKWKIPLNYRETQTGGSCQPGCHAAARYDRDDASGTADSALRTP